MNRRRNRRPSQNYARMSVEQLATKLDDMLQDKVFKNRNKISKDSVKNWPLGQALFEKDEEEFDKVYADYENQFNTVNASMNDVYRAPRRRNDDDDFGFKLNEYIKKRSQLEGFLEYDDFVKLTQNWQKGRDDHSMREWYQIYEDAFYDQPGAAMNIGPDDEVQFYGYKSKNKINKLKEKDATLRESAHAQEDPRLGKKWVKMNKKYYLHTVANPKTYLIDLMFEYNLSYLIAINVNTRYLFASVLNKKVGKNEAYDPRGVKTSRNIQNALSRMIAQGLQAKLFIGDEEPAFHSDSMKNFLRSLDKNLKIIKVERMRVNVQPEWVPNKQNYQTEPLHSSLGIIDRVIRTLRDMAYNAEVPKITPRVMSDLVYQYNNAPHEGLSRYAGTPVSPIMVQNDPELEKFIIKRILQKNYNVKMSDGYMIESLQPVQVFNGKTNMAKRRSVIQPGNFFVDGYEKGKFIVYNYDDLDDVQLLPRFRINPI